MVQDWQKQGCHGYASDQGLSPTDYDNKDRGTWRLGWYSSQLPTGNFSSQYVFNQCKDYSYVYIIKNFQTHNTTVYTSQSLTAGVMYESMGQHKSIQC